MPALLELVARALLPDVTAGVGEALPTISALAAQGTRFSGTAIAARTLGGVAPTLPKLSANEIIRQVRSMGFGVRRKDALRTIKTIREQQAAHETIASLRPGQKPRMADVPFAHQRQRLKYQVTVTVTGESRNTGELQTQLIKINSPRLITPNEAYAAAADMIDNEEAYNFASVTGTEIIGYTRQNPLIV